MLEYAWLIMLPIIGIFVVAGIMKRKRQSGSGYSRPIQNNYPDYERGREDARRREEEYQRGREDERERIRQEREHEREKDGFFKELDNIGNSFTKGAARDARNIEKSFTDSANDSANFARDFFEGPKKKRKNDW